LGYALQQQTRPFTTDEIVRNGIVKLTGVYQAVFKIMRRLPKALPQPTAHIIDWFHIAMKIQPLQQIADHVVGWDDTANSEMANVDADVRSLKWKLWHGQTNRALDQLETMTSDFAKLRERGNLSATRLLHLADPLLTYVRSNKSAIVNYGARFRSGRRIATALAESGVNSLVARRMVKKQQMQDRVDVRTDTALLSRRDRLLGRGWQDHHGSSPAGGRQPAMRGVRFNEPLLDGL
jgi:hypothetical protein